MSLQKLKLFAIQQIKLSKTDAGLSFDLTLEPGRRVYCFIGENGAGKTVLLESLAHVLLHQHSLWWGPPSWGGDLTGLYQQLVRGGLKSESVRVPPDAVIDGRNLMLKQWPVRLSQLSHSPPPNEFFTHPLVLVPATQRVTLEGIGPTALRLVGSTDEALAQALDRLIQATQRAPLEATSVAHWLSSRLLIDPRFVVGLRNVRHEAEALLRLLAAFDPDHFGGVIEEVEGETRLAVSYQDGTLRFMGRPIDRLASGYTALIKILQEVVSSIAAWEAVRGSSDILSSDAVVLIDELDAHLHPRWQRRLLPFLKQSFPRATFFVTTHSPLVVRDTDPGEAYELVRAGNEVTARALGSPRDWYLSDVLADAFHVDLPPVGTEGTDTTPSLVDLLLGYSAHVRAFAASRGTAEREAALGLYSAIVARLPADDPRLSSVTHLRQILG